MFDSNISLSSRDADVELWSWMLKVCFVDYRDCCILELLDWLSFIINYICSVDGKRDAKTRKILKLSSLDWQAYCEK